MEAMKSEHPVMEMADALEVSASGYAEHLKKDERPRRREDRELGEKLTAIFKANRKTYGAPRLQIALEQQGIPCGKQRRACSAALGCIRCRNLLASRQAGASMSRKGNCYDNAAMESFWATLKTECSAHIFHKPKNRRKS